MKKKNATEIPNKGKFTLGYLIIVFICILFLFFSADVFTQDFFSRLLEPVVPDNFFGSNQRKMKPIIYLYPEQTTNVTVVLGYPQNATHTYPKYNEPWQVQAKPDGTLTDLKTGRHYYALYWEGKDTVSMPNPKEGFVVAGKDTISFLEEKLEQLGLTEREAEEFIVYWLPKLESAKYNFIRFQTLAEQNKYMPLDITPQPKTLIRVMMEYKNLDKPIQIKEQVLSPKTQRDGFTVVEWGGTEI